MLAFFTIFFFGVQKTVLLVNHALARGTPAIFVIFVVSRGSSSKALVLLVRMQIRHFRHFRQNPPFSGGTKARFTKSTVFGTPTSLKFYMLLPILSYFLLDLRVVLYVAGRRDLKVQGKNATKGLSSMLSSRSLGTFPPLKMYLAQRIRY